LIWMALLCNSVVKSSTDIKRIGNVLVSKVFGL
jgi:hypothetical protein